LHFLDGVIPFTPLKKFSAASLFDKERAPDALLSMAHYCGYLSYQYPKSDRYGDLLVAPNDDMRNIFRDAVLDSLPGAYKREVKEKLAEGEPYFHLLEKFYNAFVTGTPPSED
jgi:hypothetical protein